MNRFQLGCKEECKHDSSDFTVVSRLDFPAVTTAAQLLLSSRSRKADFCLAHDEGLVFSSPGPMTRTFELFPTLNWLCDCESEWLFVCASVPWWTVCTRTLTLTCCDSKAKLFLNYQWNKMESIKVKAVDSWRLTMTWIGRKQSRECDKRLEIPFVIGFDSLL